MGRSLPHPTQRKTAEEESEGRQSEVGEGWERVMWKSGGRG